MPKSKNDIVTLALRQIGVAAVDEAPTADEYQYAGDILDGEFARMKVSEGFTWTWTIDEVPDALYEPLSRYLASKLTTYGVPLPSSAQAMAKIREYSLPNDVEDRSDDDEDGVLSESEELVALRATFY